MVNLESISLKFGSHNLIKDQDLLELSEELNKLDKLLSLEIAIQHSYEISSQGVQNIFTNSNLNKLKQIYLNLELNIDCKAASSIQQCLERNS